MKKINKKGQIKIQQIGISFRKSEVKLPIHSLTNERIPTMAKKTTNTLFDNFELLNLERGGQIKIQQMAFMLIAVTIFFALVGMFVLIFQFSNMKSEANKLREQNAMLLATKVANSPEFSCGSSFGTSKIGCVDTDKVIALKTKRERYENFWGTNTNIVIQKIYPRETNVECTLGNYPECSSINILGGDISGAYSNLVILCRKEISNGETYNQCDLGRIIVSYENQY